MKIVKAFGVLLLTIAITVALVGVLTLCAHDLWRVYLSSWGRGPSYEEWTGLSFLVFLILPHGTSFGVSSTTVASSSSRWVPVAKLFTIPLITWGLARIAHLVVW